MPQTPRVFISYARKDGEAFAADLVRRIEQAEIPVWRTATVCVAVRGAASFITA